MDRSSTDRGMALISVVAVLIALVLIATPFALQMQSSARRAETILYTEQADQEAQSLFAFANLYLLNSTDGNERANAAKDAKSFSTPDYDTLDEFQIPAEFLADFNRNSSRGRIWDVRVEDEQGKINVSTAPYTLLANVFGATTLSRDIEEGDGRIRIADGSVFPPEGGMVRIGSELIRYRERKGGYLEGCERGVGSDEPWNSDPQGAKRGELVMNAVAFEVASLPVRIKEGEYRPYQNIYQVKRISELGSVAMDADTFDRTADTLTCFSGREVAGGWSNSQTLRSSLPSTSSEGEGDYLVVDNPRYFGKGTLVRITDGTNTDYGIVVENDGRTITLGNRIKNDFEIDRARVESMARHPINVNTASDEVLVKCLTNLSLRLREGADSVTEQEARALVPYFRERSIKSLYQLKEILRRAKSDGLISQLDYSAIYLNALNPQDMNLGFSTVPFCFKSYDVYTVKATAVVNSRQGEEIARKTVSRVVSVNPRRSSVWSLESQNDFEGHIIASRLAKWFMTFPYNTGGHWQQARGKQNVPPSRFTPHVRRNIWPSFSTEPGVGDVRLMPERMGLDGVFHYDESHYSEGHYIREGPLSYSTKHSDVGIVEDDGMRPLAVSFWYKPQSGMGSSQYLMDSGDETWQNRVGFFYDASTRELVLRVADATLERKAVEVRYKVDAGQFQDDTWYHTSLNVTGTRPGDLSLLVDGRAVGEATYQTRLTQDLGPTAEVTELMVENADSFPERGAVVLRGEDGPEIFEYDGRSSNSFTVTRRFARMRKDVVERDEFIGRSHREGEVVELLGYAHPLLSDLPLGGASLVSDLGRWHAMKVTFGEDVLYVTGGGSGGGGDSLGQPGGEPPASHFFQDPLPTGEDPPPAGEGDGDGGGRDAGESQSAEIKGIFSAHTTVTLKLGTDIMAWDPSVNDDDAFSSFGNAGFAILVSPGPFTQIVINGETVPLPEPVGGNEIVYYEKSGNSLTIKRYQETKQLPKGDQHFVPMHTYGSEEATVLVNGEGFFTALIPISVEASGGGDIDYFDTTVEQYLNGAYAQIGTEWFSYTYPDMETAGGRTLLVWDRPSNIQNVLNLFFGGTIGVAGDGDPDVNPPDDPPPDDDDTTPPDDEPPPPEPPSPPPPPDPGGGPGPGPGGEDDGGPGDGTTPPPPDPEPGPGGEDDSGPGDGTTPPPPDPEPGPGGEDDSGPGDGETPPPPDPEPGPGGEDDTGPGGGETPPPEPPLPPGGEDDGGPGDGETPRPDPGGEEPPPDDGGEEPPPAEEPPADGSPAGGPDGGGRAPSDSPGGAGDDVPFLEISIADRLNHRPVGTVDDANAGAPFHRIADTYAEDHVTGDEVLPAFLVAAHQGLYAGYDDLITLATIDGPQEELRIQHGYVEGGLTNWVALTSFASTGYDYAEDDRSGIVAGTVETRQVPRVLKFPSGELPTDVADNVYFGSRYDGSGLSQAFLDELYFRKNVNDRIYYLGDGALLETSQQDDGPRWPYTDEQQSDIMIHMWPTSSNPDGLPVTGLPEDGGVIRIDDEVIVYEELETATGTLKNCQRAALDLNGEAAIHSFGARVTEVDAVTMAVLEGGVGTTSYEITLNRVTGFPRQGGYVRIDDEIIGYTRAEGNTLLMPQDLDAAEEDEFELGSDAGAGIFRGRFGTEVMEHSDKAFVFYWPARFPDRYQERSVDPETSAFTVSKRVDGAIWKRISWDEKLVEFTDVKVLVRFDGTPEWDSDKIYSVDDQMVISGSTEEYRKDPKSFLYLVTSPHAKNRFGPNLGIQADWVEMRIQFQYQAGAFNDFAETPANSWKDSPWLKALRLEYVAPVTVHYTEEIR